MIKRPSCPSVACHRTLAGLFQGIPIIGIAGGIGSGKSFVARLFGDLGCYVIDSDSQVRKAYGLAEVQEAVRGWWGEQVVSSDGAVNRRAIAAAIFGDAAERSRLERLLHPMVARMRDDEMTKAVRNNPPVAFIWDTPLLFETGLDSECDAIVFVDVPWAERLARVQKSRGWTADELMRRENSQWPLDNKRALSDYVYTNTAGAVSPLEYVSDEDHSAKAYFEGDTRAESLRDQVRLLLSRILAAT